MALLKVYYAVGQNTTDHQSGAGNVTVAGNTATFTVAQVDTAMGVGDRLTYDGAIAYISGKTSSTVWSVVNAIGGTPTAKTNVAVTSIAHEYTSMSAAEAGYTDASHTNNVDLTAADIQVNLPCYFDTAADTTVVVINGATTDATRYLRIYAPSDTATECNQSQKHIGKWTATAYSLEVADNSINMRDPAVHIDGLQVKCTPNGDWDIGINAEIDAGGKHYVSDCIVVVDNTGARANIKGINNNNNDMEVKNCIVYAIAGSIDGIVQTTAGGTLTVYQCTVRGCVDGYERDAGTMTVTNSASFDNTDDFDGTITIDYCASDDGDGTNAQSLGGNAAGWNAAFTDYANADFSVKDSSSVLYDNGADLTAQGVTDDIIGTSRPQNGAYDIGAFEKIASSVSVTSKAAFGAGHEWDTSGTDLEYVDLDN